jgi:hypothetical protein
LVLWVWSSDLGIGGLQLGAVDFSNWSSDFKILRLGVFVQSRNLCYKYYFFHHATLVGLRSSLVSDLAAALTGTAQSSTSRIYVKWVPGESSSDQVEEHFEVLQAVVRCLVATRQTRQDKPFAPPAAVFEEAFLVMGLASEQALVQGLALKRMLARVLHNARRTDTSPSGKAHALKQMLPKSHVPQ